MASTASNLTAVILAGGKGERLRPITAALPKALVPLRGVPILKRLLDFLYGQGVSKFVVCTGYLAAQVEEFTDTLDRRDWSLKCVDSGDAAMTTRLIDARRHATGRILVCYGDTLANVDVEKLVREHEAAGNIATVSVFPLVSPFGIVDFDDSGRVQHFREKPQLPHWVNIGFVVLEPEVVGYLEADRDLVQFLTAVAKGGGLGVYRHTGGHLTVNTEKERMEAEEHVEDFFTLLEGDEVE